MAVLLTDGATQSAAAATVWTAVGVLVKPASAAGPAPARTTIATTAVAPRLDTRRLDTRRRGLPFEPGVQIAPSIEARSSSGTRWTVAWWTGADRSVRMRFPAEGMTATRRQA